MSSAMRRPGNVVSERVSVVRGSDSASTKNGRPASASISAPWRDNDARDQPGLLTIAGRAMRRFAGLRPPNDRIDDEDCGEPDQGNQQLLGDRLLGKDQAIQIEIAPLGPQGRDRFPRVANLIAFFQALKPSSPQALRPSGPHFSSQIDNRLREVASPFGRQRVRRSLLLGHANRRRHRVVEVAGFLGSSITRGGQRSERVGQAMRCRCGRSRFRGGRSRHEGPAAAERT